MKVIVISKYSLIREGISSIITKNDNIKIQLICKTIEEAMFTIKNNPTDIIIIDLHKENLAELNFIDEIINSNIRTKFLVLDFQGSNDIFVKALKFGVHAYILGKSNESEIFYAINQVYNGKKYFDSYFVSNMVNGERCENNIELLTVREKEILLEISKGTNNKKIGEKLFITENTVKKHISNIFHKLNVNNRTEIALLTNKYKISDK